MAERFFRHGHELAEDIATYRVPEGTVACWFLGQAAVVLKSTAGVLLIDPYFRENPGRLYPPPLHIDELAAIDWVLCTHHHLDHLDPGTVGPLARRFPQCRVVVPEPHLGIALDAGVSRDQLVTAVVGESIEGRSLKITPLRAKHEEFELNARGNHLYLGYVVETDDIRLFHAGDTVGFDGQAEDLQPFRPHVVFLPINGRDWLRNRRNIAGNMNYREAVDLVQMVRAELIVPLHYDLFTGNTENPAFFVDHLFRTCPGQAFKMLAIGERFLVAP
ncbi:MAG: MBL fold metallo-hydrolase [Chloroflexi bacterium]|nr:MBL fold metallo-hydrolase [Chloroflexota bacterium]